MKKTVTLHIDRNSTLQDVEAAGRILAEAANKTATRQFIAETSEIIRRMVRTLNAPFEVRLGAPDAPPVLVVHPQDRALGEKRRQEAQLLDEWCTTKLE